MNFGVASVHGQIHALLHSSHYVYSPTTNQWAISTPMTVPRHGFGISVIRNSLYVFGGCHVELFDTQTTEVLHVTQLEKRPQRSAIWPMLIAVGGIITLVTAFWVARHSSARV
jgi:hypothetical protein